MTSMFPLTGAAEDLWFETGQYTTAATSLLSCTRASIGYATTSSGTLTQFGTNTLRITDVGLLVEDARTNYAIQSQEIDNTVTPWNAFGLSGVTCTLNTTVAPDGTTTADTLAFASTGPGSSGFIYASTTTPNGTADNTASIYLKGAVGGEKVAFRISSPSVSYVLCTLTTSWQRFTLTANLTTIGGSGFQFGLDGRSAIDAGLTATSFTIYAWGAQAELGSFASSYIPTTSAAATRAADSMTAISTASTVLAGAVATFVWESGSGSTIEAGTKMIVAGAARYARSGNVLTQIVFWNNSADLIATIGGSKTLGTDSIKAGAAWDGSGRSLVAANGTVATDGGAVGTAGTTGIGPGCLGDVGHIGYVKRLTLWTSRIADATLQDLTNPNSSYYTTTTTTTLFAQACL